MSQIIWQDPGGASSLANGISIDPVTGAVTVVYRQDVNRILDLNQIRRNQEIDHKRRKSGQLYQVAEIPLVTVMLWKEKFGVDIHNADHWGAVRELLHDPEWKGLRVEETRFLERPKRSYVPRAQPGLHPLGKRAPTILNAAGGLLSGTG